MTIEEAAQILLEGKVMRECHDCNASGVVPNHDKPPKEDGSFYTTWCKTCSGARVVFYEPWLEAWELINPGDGDGKANARHAAVAKHWVLLGRMTKGSRLNT